VPLDQGARHQARERVRVEGLAQEVGRSHLGGGAMQVRHRREQDDRNLLVAAIADDQLVGHLRAGDDGHLDVQHHQVRRPLRDQAQPLPPVVRDANAVTLGLQKRGQELGEVRIVVDDE